MQLVHHPFGVTCPEGREAGAWGVSYIINAFLGNVHIHVHTVVLLHEPARPPYPGSHLIYLSRREEPDPTEETNEGVEREQAAAWWWSRSQGGRSGWSPGSGDEVALAHREMVILGSQQQGTY